MATRYEVVDDEVQIRVPSPAPEEEEEEHFEIAPEQPLKMNTLKPERFDGKTVDWDSWIAQFTEWANACKWGEDTKSSALTLSLTGTARMYYGDLPTDEKKDYATRVAALERRFGRRRDRVVAMQKLSSVRRQKDEDVRDLADRVRRMVRTAYPDVTGDTRELAAVAAFQRALADTLHLKCLEAKCTTLDAAIQVVETQERFRAKSVSVVQQQTPATPAWRKEMEEIIAQELKKIRGDGPAQEESRPRKPRFTGCYQCGKQGHFKRDCPDLPTQGNAKQPTQ